MDAKMIELNNLRLLNDYLNQTIEVLVRGQRPGVGYGHTQFGLGTDVIPSLFSQPSAFAGGGYSPFAGYSPFGGYGNFPTAIDPFYAQRGLGHTQSVFGGWQQPWSPIPDVSRQAQIAQALAARQSVLETMCRVAGIV
jgi:hypothetical protein